MRWNAPQVSPVTQVNPALPGVRGAKTFLGAAARTYHLGGAFRRPLRVGRHGPRGAPFGDDPATPVPDVSWLFGARRW